MRGLRRDRVGLALTGLVVALAVLLVHRLRDQQARAVSRTRPEVVGGVGTPERRTVEVKLAFDDQEPSTRLLASFSGYIAQRNLDPGAAVSAQSAGTTTASVGILTVNELRRHRLELHDAVVQAGRIRLTPIICGA